MSLPVKNRFHSDLKKNIGKERGHDMRYVMSIILGSPLLLSCGNREADCERTEILCKSSFDSKEKKKKACNLKTNWVFVSSKDLLSLEIVAIFYALNFFLYKAVNLKILVSNVTMAIKF